VAEPPLWKEWGRGPVFVLRYSKGGVGGSGGEGAHKGWWHGDRHESVGRAEKESLSCNEKVTRAFRGEAWGGGAGMGPRVTRSREGGERPRGGKERVGSVGIFERAEGVGSRAISFRRGLRGGERGLGVMEGGGGVIGG